MPASNNSKKNESASTYIVYDNKKKAEIERLVTQERMFRIAMGGILLEQTNPDNFHSVLDVACGPGGWMLEVARSHPQTHLVGVDINPRMLEYARKQANEQNVAHQVEFREMDVLQKLDFPDNSFDLVNLQFGVSFVRTWDWPKLLLEMQRVTRPGGILRLTESEASTQSMGIALTDYDRIGIQVMYRAGYLFTEENAGLTGHLAELLTNAWCEDVQTRTYPLEFHVGTPEGKLFCEDMKYLHQAIRPFLQKWVTLPDDYEARTRQVQKDMERPDFWAVWPILVAWGRKPLTVRK